MTNVSKQSWIETIADTLGCEVELEISTGLIKSKTVTHRHETDTPPIVLLFKPEIRCSRVHDTNGALVFAKLKRKLYAMVFYDAVQEETYCVLVNIAKMPLSFEPRQAFKGSRSMMDAMRMLEKAALRVWRRKDGDDSPARWQALELTDLYGEQPQQAQAT